MRLLNPKSYRLKPEHERWLKAKATQEGHGNAALSLRLFLDREIKKERPHQKGA